MIRRALLGVLVTWVVWGIPAGAQIQQTTPGFTAAEIKAAFIVNLFSFIVWPNETVPHNLCVSESNAMTEALAALLAARSTFAMELKQVAQDSPHSGDCDVLVISAEGAPKPPRPSSGAPLMTISDQPGFAARGGMIELERRPNRIGLVINRALLESQGFQVSSRLLALARVIEPEGVDDGA